MFYSNFFFRLVFITLFFISCKQINLHESHAFIKDFNWQASQPALGKFSITDTNALYRVFIVLRHQDGYNYNNIWLNVGLQAPGDSMRYQKLEVPLGNDAKGWYGAGMNNIWEMRHQLTNGPQKFLKPGIYNYSIAHIMREDPLKNVMNVGMRIEKLP